MADLVVPAKIIVKCLAIICFVLASLLLIWPNLFARANLFFKTWFSTARFEKELNRTHDVDAQLLHMRRILGIIAVVLALIFVLILLK